LTSKTPVVTSGDLNAKVASHLSKVPSIATDAFTANLIVLAAGVITKTGIPAGSCALVTDENRTDAKRQKVVSRTLGIKLEEVIIAIEAQFGT
jgi:hypothetical protein